MLIRSPIVGGHCDCRPGTVGCVGSAGGAVAMVQLMDLFLDFSILLEPERMLRGLIADHGSIERAYAATPALTLRILESLLRVDPAAAVRHLQGLRRPPG